LGISFFISLFSFETTTSEIEKVLFLQDKKINLIIKEVLEHFQQIVEENLINILYLSDV